MDDETHQKLQIAFRNTVQDKFKALREEQHLRDLKKILDHKQDTNKKRIVFLLVRNKYKESLVENCPHALERDGLEIPISDRYLEFIKALSKHKKREPSVKILNEMNKHFSSKIENSELPKICAQINKKFQQKTNHTNPLIDPSGKSRKGYRLNPLYEVIEVSKDISSQ